MHANVKRFGFSGVIRDDCDFLRIRVQYEQILIHQMRTDGYVPVLTLGPLFSTKMIDKGYEFDVTVYGVYVGKKKACLIEGMDELGRWQPRSTQRTKLPQH